MAFIEKSRPNRNTSSAFVQARDAWFAKEFPALLEYLTVGELPGGETRQLSSLTLFVEQGIWKLCLAEKDAEVNLFGSGDSVELALANLEERLKAPNVDWRRRSGGGTRGPGKRS